MSQAVRRCWFCSCFVLTGLGIVLGWWYFSRPAPPLEGPPAKDVEAVAANSQSEESAAKNLETIWSEWDQAQQEYQKALRDAKSRAEREKLKAEKAPNPARFAERCLDLARNHPGTLGELAALWWIVHHTPDTSVGKEAINTLTMGRIAFADVGQLADALRCQSVDASATEAARGLAHVVLNSVKKNPAHPKVAWLLNWVCVYQSEELQQKGPPRPFAEAADLIVQWQAASPDITNFCECLGMGHGSPPWAGQYERHLRTILKENRHRRVRGAAQFALASVVQNTGGEARQDEAGELYQQYIKDYDGSDPENGPVEQNLRRCAKDELDCVQSRAIGRPAREIVGLDLDDRPMKLSEYRGKAVLLSFWGTWCFPCMKLVPHERELVSRFTGQPFALVGVNCDSDVQKAREAVIQTKMTWRSFRDQVGNEPTITKDWKPLGYPTLYLIDHHGTIRKRWVGSPRTDELDHMVGVLVDAARRNVPADAMKPIVAALTLPESKTTPSPAALETASPRSGAGFLDKVYRGPDGSESKYVVFVPRTYEGAKLFPAILFLHGSGARGSDGQLPVRGGLAKAIKAKNEEFPFIVIFPQAHEDENWGAESEGGKRALAILNQVLKDYRIDEERISLTGVSMGGFGIWSLAVSDPKRWASIVPICHGGDTNTAARLKDVPCWCFHGDADKVIPVQRSREMVEAIQKAGGRPLYQEFPGIDHNSCADRVYAMNDLYEWMLLQNRAKR